MPIKSISAIVLEVALVLIGFKFAILAIGLLAYKWRVAFDGDRVTFFQGTHCVAVCRMMPEEVDHVTLIDQQWIPRRLLIVKTNGERLETLYGVALADLSIVVNRLQSMLDMAQTEEE